jgi:Protein of unknown function (DUF3341)
MSHEHDHHTNKYLVGVYEDDEVLLSAVHSVRHAGVNVYEVYTPFPIHGMDDALGYKRSRLDIAAFMFACTGTVFAVTMMTLMLGVDWPMNIGGKPFVAPPDFIPISFEMTVLFAALGMVTTFLLASGLGPGANKMVLDPRFSDDKFILAVDLDRNQLSSDQITLLLRESGAAEVNTKEVDV